MGSRYGVFLEVFNDALPGSQSSVCVWIQSVVDGRDNLPQLERGPLVYPVKHGLRGGSKGLSLWICYAERLAAGWNLLVTVANLLGLPKTTPWMKLANKISEKGRDDLAHELGWYFESKMFEGRTGEQPLCLPSDLPAEVGGDGASLIV